MLLNIQNVVIIIIVVVVVIVVAGQFHSPSFRFLYPGLFLNRNTGLTNSWLLLPSMKYSTTTRRNLLRFSESTVANSYTGRTGPSYTESRSTEKECYMKYKMNGTVIELQSEWDNPPRGICDEMQGLCERLFFFLHPLIKLKAKKSGKFEYLGAIKDRKPEGGGRD